MRERLRLQAVERFEGGQKNGEIAAALRVSVRSVERWRRAWREQGEGGVLSAGSPGRPRLSDGQIGRLFHVSYTIEGTWQFLKRE